MAQLDSVEIKEKLQKAFPKFKFSVTRSTFAGGHSVSVRVLSGDIKAMKDDSDSGYVSSLEYDRESNRLTDQMNAFLKKVRDIIDQVGSYNNRHGSSWLGLSLGTYSKPYVQTSSSSSSSSNPTYTSQNRSGSRANFDYGIILGSGYGWDLYKKYISDKDVNVYNLVKKPETKPNRDKWDEIKGLLLTQEAFKWNPRGQTFQRWYKDDLSEVSMQNLFRILGQYYDGSQVELTTMPTPQPTSDEESILQVGDFFKYTDQNISGYLDFEQIYRVEKITDQVFISWVDKRFPQNSESLYNWVSVMAANKLLKEGKVVVVDSNTQTQNPTQQPQIDYTKFATRYDPNNVRFYDLLYYPNNNYFFRIDSLEDANGNPINTSIQTLSALDIVVVEFKEMGEMKKSKFTFYSFSDMIKRGEFIYLGEVEVGDFYEKNEIRSDVYLSKYEITLATSKFVEYNYTYTDGIEGAGDNSRDYFTYFLIVNDFRLTKRRGIVLDEPQPTPSGIMREITDREAREVADAFMEKDDYAFLILKISSASDIYQNKDLQDKYVARMKIAIGNLMRNTKFNYLKNEILNRSLDKVYKRLENDNYSVLNNFLSLYGFYGAEKQREAIERYNKYMETNLKPFKNEPEAPTPPPTTNEEFTITKDCLLIFRETNRINLVVEVKNDTIKTEFFDFVNGGVKNVYLTKNYWVSKIKSGEVIRVRKLEKGDIFEYGNLSDTYYIVNGVDETEKNISYDIYNGKGEVVDTIKMDLKTFYELLISNKFYWTPIYPFRPTQENKKEKLEKAIKGLQYLADKGNEKAEKAIKGLKYLLNK